MDLVLDLDLVMDHQRPDRGCRRHNQWI